MRLRKAMIRVCSGIRAATSGSTFARRARASPTMPNLRSTAARRISSARYCSKFFPAQNAAMLSAACCISKRYFRASSRIKQGLLLLHALPEIGVTEVGWSDKIDREVEQLPQCVAKLEVGVGVLPGRKISQVNEKIQIVRPLAGAGHRLTEYFQTTNAQSCADAGDLIAALQEFTAAGLIHGCPRIAYEAYSLGLQRYTPVAVVSHTR